MVAADQSALSASATSAGPKGAVANGEEAEQWAWAQAASGFTPDLNYIELHIQVRDVGLRTDINPFANHSTTGEFDSPQILTDPHVRVEP